MRARVLIGYSCCPLTLEAFERAGCEAWTCDLLPSRGRPDRHLQCDVREIVHGKWDAAIFHPMCTYLTVSAAWAFNDPDYDRYPGVGYHQKVAPGTLTGGLRRAARARDLENFEWLLALPYPKAIENPANSFVNKSIRPPDQTVQPYCFGDDASKATGLWLDGIPRLKPTQRVQGRMVPRHRAMGKSDRANGNKGPAFLERWSNQTDSGQNRLSPGEDRWLERSATYPGIGAAMGGQWGAWLMAGRPDAQPDLFAGRG